MHTAFLQTIDWTRPWLNHVRDAGQAIAQTPDWCAELNRRITQLDVRNHLGKPIHFVPQATLPANKGYEQFISETGGVPTRDNLHDFFNALVWLHFPQIKVQLNALQAREIARVETELQSDLPATAGKITIKVRGKVRDAATIFDENAVLLVVSDPSIVNALRTHQWQTLFIARRDAFLAQCRVCLFGHALMEKLVHPYKAITGHAWIVATDPVAQPSLSLHAGDMVDVGDNNLEQLQLGGLDAQVARQLMAGLNTADFSPLPVLGVPGWWVGQDADFYADTGVFRPARVMR